MSGSRTIIAEQDDRLPNPHPGDILREDFLIGDEIELVEVAEKAGVDTGTLTALLDAKIAVDAMTDLRLGRYFGMSEGFFLRLQNAYDLEEARRASGLAIDHIEPRAMRAA